MAKRGPRKHLKRLSAPKHWMLSKVGGIWATKPSTGPHRLRECVPLNVILRNKLKLALNNREAKLIVMAKEGNVAIDAKIRKDVKYPCGFMDVLTLVKAKTSYRLLYDCKGKFTLNKISNTEAEYKLCKVKARSMGPKGIPYIVTHDGRTIRFPDPSIKEGDTVRVNLTNGEITEYYKFKEGAHVMISGGNNIGRMGKLVKFEKHDGSYDIITVEDPNGERFSTRRNNIFVVGENKAEISILKSHNRLTIINEKSIRTKRKHVEYEENQEDDE